MNNAPISVKGDKVLLEALENKLLSLGYTKSQTSWVKLYLVIYPKDKVFQYLNESMEYVIYSLPEQWNEVVEYVTEKPKFKEGDYVKIHGQPYIYHIIQDFRNVATPYKVDLPTVYNQFKGQCQLATDEEIEKELIRQAELRGLKIGSTIQFTFSSGQHWAVKIGDFKYNSEEDELTLMHVHGEFSAALTDEGFIERDYSNDSSRTVCGIYVNGKWLVSNIKPYIETPVLSFGGKSVNFQIVSYCSPATPYDVLITCEGISDYYSNLVKFREASDLIKNFSFGTAKRDLSLSKEQYEEKLSTRKLKFGCSTGIYKEILDILAACEKLLNVDKTKKC